MSRTRQIETLLEELSPDELLALIEYIAQRLRQREKRTPQPLYGIWRGKFTEDVDIEAALKEIRHQVSDCVADTHALYWYLTARPMLGEHARNALLAAEQGQAVVYIPSIVIAELYYLNVKLGQPLNFAQEFQRLAAAG